MRQGNSWRIFFNQKNSNMEELLPDVFVSDYQIKYPIIIEIEQDWSNKGLWCYVAAGEFRVLYLLLPACIFSHN